VFYSFNTVSFLVFSNSHKRTKAKFPENFLSEIVRNSRHNKGAFTEAGPTKPSFVGSGGYVRKLYSQESPV